MSRQIAADLSARSSLKKSEAIAAIKARASLIADFKNGGYKLYTPETGLARTEFANIFSFTRASVASVDTYAGVADIAVDQPRFSAGKGLRIEESRENLLTFSEEFDNAGWIKGDTTITANDTTAPDGSLTADKLVENAQSDQHFARQDVTPSGQACSSVYVKAAERTKCYLLIVNGNFGDRVEFDLAKGVITDDPSGLNPFIEESTNGFYRIGIEDNGSIVSFVLGILNEAGEITYTGDGTSGLYIWGAQVEEGSFPTTYIPTGASSVVRSGEATLTDAISAFEGSGGGTFYLDFTVPFLNGVGTSDALVALSTALSGGDFNSLTSIEGRGRFTIPNGNMYGVGGVVSGDRVQVAFNPLAATAYVTSSGRNTIGGYTPSRFEEVSIGYRIRSGGGGDTFGSVLFREFLYIPENLTLDEMITLTEPN